MKKKMRKILLACSLLTLSVCLIILAIQTVAVTTETQQYRGLQSSVAAEKETADDETPPVRLDWTALEDNENAVGWIYAGADEPDDVISYPVAYKAGDRSFYLNHDISSCWSWLGAPFIPGEVDVSNAAVISIHGHNFGAGKHTMFSPLLLYEDSNYTARHPNVWYAEKGGQLEEYRIFSVMVFNADDLGIWNYFQTIFENEDQYNDWVAYAVKESVYSAPAIPAAGNKIIVLSTCDRRQYRNGRCLVLAYLQPQ